MFLKLIIICILTFKKCACLECEDFCTQPNFSSENCFCNQCDLFDDCCQNIEKPHKLSGYECNSELHSNYFIYTIGQCPSNFSHHSIVQKCENSTDLIGKTPVFSNQSGNFYKNIFCAKCNLFKMDLDKLAIFTVAVGASSFLIGSNLNKNIYQNSTIEQILNGSSSYEIVFKSPNDIIKPRHCIKSIDSCPTNYPNHTVERLCKNHTAYRYQKSSIYKNQYCAFCNGIERVDCGIYFTNKAFIQSLQILFDLSESNGEVYLSMNASKFLKNNPVFSQEVKLEDFFNEKSLPCLPISPNLYIKADMVKKYATLVGHAISIVSLVLLLASYFTNKNLRNLPGKILMNLSTSLIFSQLSFIVSTYYTKSLIDIIYDFMDNKCLLPKLINHFDDLKILFLHIKLIIPCFLSGMLTHYFYLVFFLWSNIMAFDLFKMFTKSVHSTPKNVQSDSKLFFKYCLLAWLLPLAIIIILLVKNYNKLSYGFNQCFISVKLDLLIFFVVPVVAILSMNLVFLVVSIKAITGVDILKKKYIKNAVPAISFSGLKPCQEHHSLKKRLVLYLKLFILTGMTWIIGLISALINKQYSFLWYIFIFLNSLQGLFIFCSYSFNENSNSNFILNFLKIFNCFRTKRKYSINLASAVKPTIS